MDGKHVGIAVLSFTQQGPHPPTFPPKAKMQNALPLPEKGTPINSGNNMRNGAPSRPSTG
jgi:hypothetical protein